MNQSKIERLPGTFQFQLQFIAQDLKGLRDNPFDHAKRKHAEKIEAALEILRDQLHEATAA